MKIAAWIIAILLVGATIAETALAGTCISRRQWDGSVITQCY